MILGGFCDGEVTEVTIEAFLMPREKKVINKLTNWSNIPQLSNNSENSCVDHDFLNIYLWKQVKQDLMPASAPTILSSCPGGEHRHRYK